MSCLQCLSAGDGKARTESARERANGVAPRIVQRRRGYAHVTARVLRGHKSCRGVLKDGVALLGVSNALEDGGDPLAASYAHRRQRKAAACAV
jgi:hypothetical protein